MDVTIARWRLVNQRLTAPQASSAAEVVDTLLAVQAENPSQSAWAVATRTSAPDPGDLAGLLDSGAVLRTHVLRATWHYVARDDLDWLLALTGPALRANLVPLLGRDFGLDGPAIDHIAAVVLDGLADAPDQTRDEVARGVRDRLPDLAELITGRAMALVMAYLELDRLVVSGRPRRGAHTYAAYVSRVGTRVSPEVFDREAALARIALRYLAGHGPATARDLAYWATLTSAEARRGLDAARDRLASFEHGGRTFFHLPGAPPSRPAEPAGHLLQLLDETYRGYQDSRWALDARCVVPRRREAAIGIALVDGQLVAGMRRDIRKAEVRFDLAPHRRLLAAERLALEEAAARYGAFLGLPARVTGLG